MNNRTAKSILIRGARQLLTLNGPSSPRRGEALNSLGIIQDGAVLIVDGIVSAVGPSRRVENLAEARDAEEINAAGRVVMPALVDAHAHLIGGASLVDRDDFELLDAGPSALHMTMKPQLGSGGQIRKTPAKSIEHRGRKLLDLCAMHGTGTLEAKSGYGLDEGTETKLLRVLREYQNAMVNVVPTFLIPFDVHSSGTDFRNEYLKWLGSEFLPRISAKKLARFVAVECEGRGGCRTEYVSALLDAIVAAELVPKVHTTGADSAGVEAAIRNRAVTVEGLIAVTPACANAVAKSSAIGVLLAADSLASDPPAVGRKLVDAGAAVALGSGLHNERGSTYNMQTVIALACSRFKMTAAEAISAATINAAHATGTAATAGSLQFGKDADILILSISDYREMSYYFGVNQVHLGLKRGQPVFHDAAVTV